MRSVLIASLIGGMLGALLPAKAVLSASAELISFVTLILAGLIPAMILTATALRGDSFSSVRVREYAEGLRRQLRFWAVLFGFCLTTVVMICAAKISDQASSIKLGIDSWSIEFATNGLTRGLLIVGSAAFFVVLSRMYPAYRGLRSLLELTIRMAEVQALANDRSFSDALDAKVSRVLGQPKTTSEADWPSS